MTTVTISLPNQIARQVDEETQKKGFATRSEFVRNLLREYFVKETKESVVFHEFKKKPLSEIRAELAKTGKYSEKFIDSVVNGLSESSVYED